MSKNKKTVFSGAATALITPFCNGEIDYKALSGLIDFQIDGKIETIVIAGTTGEAPTITWREYEKLFKFATKYANGRAKIIAGCGTNSTRRSTEIAKIAYEGGCECVLAVTPYYNKPTNQGLVEGFIALADASPIPVILYNVPSRTGTNISMECYRELSRHENIVGVKEASGSISAVADILTEFGDDLDVYTGNDDMIVPTMSIGGSGAISVVSNILPFETGRLCKLCLNGSYKEAAELQLDLIPIIRALFKETNPIPVKYALSRLGFCLPEYRLPMCPPTDETKTFIDAVLSSI